MRAVVLQSSDLRYGKLLKIALAMLLACGLWYANGVQYLVQHASVMTAGQVHQVHPTAHLSSEKLRQLIPVGSVWVLDLEKLARRVRESSVWVKDVRLRRRFPNMLVMKVVEYEFAGMYQDPADKKQYCLITSTGEVIRVKAKYAKHAGLENLCVVSGSKFLTADFLSVWKLLGKYGVQVKALRYTPYGGWNVITSDATVVKLSPKHPESSIKAFVKCEDVKPGSIVDVCYVPRVTYTPEVDTHIDAVVTNH